MVSSGMVTSMGLPAAARSQTEVGDGGAGFRVGGGAVKVGSVMGVRVNKADIDRVGVGLTKRAGVAVKASGFCPDCVTNAWTVSCAWVALMVGAASPPLLQPVRTSGSSAVSVSAARRNGFFMT